ncbi:MAG TPA: cytochrome c biogenesis heme-transporting ATPase CcmA [Pyrinomonadaceae bacterium]|nr:cytochrome c biogenesis heme-transporting ATPase CcmA [Pyrinomonadaceae bacterium]
MLEAENLECTRGDRKLFRHLDFSVQSGTLVQLMGPNGSGKTSLLRMISGLLQPTEGQIRWDGTNIRSLGEDYRALLTYLGHRNGLKEELSALENLRITTGLSGLDPDVTTRKEALKAIGLAGRDHLPVRLLSEGQKRRAALARLMITKTRLWLLDEVFTALDKSAVALVKNLIESHLNNGGLAIIATHQELNLSASSFMRIELAS